MSLSKFEYYSNSISTKNRGTPLEANEDDLVQPESDNESEPGSKTNAETTTKSLESLKQRLDRIHRKIWNEVQCRVNDRTFCRMPLIRHPECEQFLGRRPFWNPQNPWNSRNRQYPDEYIRE